MGHDQVPSLLLCLVSLSRLCLCLPLPPPLSPSLSLPPSLPPSLHPLSLLLSGCL